MLSRTAIANGLISAVIGASVLLGGCGESRTTGGGAGGSSASGGDDGGSASGAVNLVGPVVTVAAIISRSESKGTAFASTFINADFAEDAALTLPAPGGCIVPPASGDTGLVSGGTVTIAGATKPITIVASGMTGTTYSFMDDKGADWSAGATLKLSASGGPDIPAFSISGVAPAGADLTTPMAGGSIALAETLKLAWNPIASGQVFVILNGPPAGGSANQMVTLECLFDGSEGSGTISSMELSLFGAGAGTLTTESLSLTIAEDKAWHVAFAIEEQGDPTRAVTFH